MDKDPKTAESAVVPQVETYAGNEVVRMSNVAFAYLGREEPAIQVDSFTLNEGESVLIVGKSGEGKSTFVNLINGVIPHIFRGDLKGEVYVYGKKVKDTPISKLCTDVGTLLQDPETQVLNYTVEEEVAFGPENLGLPPEEILRRVEKAMEETGIGELRERETYTLSGGELQRVALAAVLAMEPKLLILDEPTSNIDPEATAKIFDILRSFRGRKTLLVVEHKVELMLPYVDRVILIEKGKIKFNVKKEELLDHLEELKEAGVEVPEVYMLAKQFGLPKPDFNEVKRIIKEKGIKLPSPTRLKPSKTVLEAKAKVWVKEKVLLDAELSLGEGEILAMMGRNGAGKTTFLKAIMGVLDKTSVSWDLKLIVNGADLSRANIQQRGRYIAYVPQNFELTIVSTRVENEVAYSLKRHKVPNWKERLEELLKMFSLDEVRDKDPLSLSMGQERRVAMASALGTGAKIVLLDEPTSGQDYYHKEILGKELKRLQSMGYSFIVVTHDARFVYNYADRVVVLSGGHKVLDGPPEEVFLKSEQYGIPPPSEFLLRADVA